MFHMFRQIKFHTIQINNELKHVMIKLLFDVISFIEIILIIRQTILNRFIMQKYFVKSSNMF